MGYQNPAFLIAHAIAERLAVAEANVTVDAGLVGDDTEARYRLGDYRDALICEWDAAATGHYVRIDLGATPDPDGLDRLLIPAGHNFAGADVRVRQATDAAFTTGVDTLLAATAVAAGFYLATITASSKRYLEVAAPNDSLKWQLPEVWLSTFRQTSTGIVRAWRNPLEAQVNVQRFPSRDSVAILAPPRRVWEFEHQGVSGADLTLYDDLAATGRHVPFYFYPPDDDAADPILMLLDEDPEREQDHPIPQSAMTYTIRLRMLEQTS